MDPVPSDIAAVYIKDPFPPDEGKVPEEGGEQLENDYQPDEE